MSPKKIDSNFNRSYSPNKEIAETKRSTDHQKRHLESVERITNQSTRTTPSDRIVTITHMIRSFVPRHVKGILSLITYMIGTTANRVMPRWLRRHPVSGSSRWSHAHDRKPWRRTSWRSVPLGDLKDLPPLLILVADDVRMNRELIREHLVGTPHQVLEASQGREAIDLIVKHRPDVVLLYLHMPVMDGLQAARAISTDPLLVQTPLIALVTPPESPDRTKILHNFDRILTKPVERSALNLALRSVLPMD